MSYSQKSICIVGAGLAGSECAYQLAEKGYQVELIEMRGSGKSASNTPAHKTSLFAELVCSNSLGSETDYSAPGQLKWEAERMNSLILKAAREAKVPAGMALGVDRNIFAKNITSILESHPLIQVTNEVFSDLDNIENPTVIATGPLTHPDLTEALRKHFNNETVGGAGDANSEGDEFLYFYDAIAPIIDTDSINKDITWKANRFDDNKGDYINCPLNKEEYFNLIESIKSAQKVELKEFEKTPYFDACMPIEAIVERGDRTLRFGPMSPKGLINPRTKKNEYAIVQLRQENKSATAYNMVGFQTKMTYSEQKRIFRQIPGLEEAEFLKLGSIHKNLYLHSPKKLTSHLQSQKNSNLFFAGQITGVEGYFESTCIGLMVAYFVDAFNCKKDFNFPRTSAFGSLLNAVTEDRKHFQPTNINFGLFPPQQRPNGGKDKREYRDLLLQKARSDFNIFYNENLKK